MNIDAYFRSLSEELKSQRDRVRQLIGGRHWPTDGHWKETVLRSVMARSMGAGVHIGSGFVVSGTDISQEIDLLVYRADSPVLFRDGNLVIVPVEAVLGIIEVKSSLNGRSARSGLEHLGRTAQMLGLRRSQVLLGLFGYESVVSNSYVLTSLRTHCSRWPCQVDLVCNGPARLVRWWRSRPGANDTYQRWHSYDLPNLSFGYFINNFVSHALPEGFRRTGPPLFPVEGKEMHRDGAVFAEGALLERLEYLRSDEIAAEF